MGAHGTAGPLSRSGFANQLLPKSEVAGKGFPARVWEPAVLAGMNRADTLPSGGHPSRGPAAAGPSPAATPPFPPVHAIHTRRGPPAASGPGSNPVTR